MIYEGHKVYMNGKYPAIWLNGTNCHIHRLVWEKQNGEIPKGYVIHHKDENKMNWNLDNLELLNRSKHIQEHSNTIHRKGVPVVAVKGDVVLHFNSIENAAEGCGTYPNSVQRVIRNKQKKANGWIFMKEGDCYSIL